MIELLLVRHGATDWNAEKRFQGHSDIPLNQLGIRQAEALAQRLSAQPLEVVYTSDLARARDTAETINRELNLEIIPEPLLREIDFGDWEGLTYSEIGERDPQAAAAWDEDLKNFKPPGGESLSELIVRVRTFLDQITEGAQDDKILVVSHGGPLQVLLCLAMGLPAEDFWRIRLETASLSRLSLTPQGALLNLVNDACHLSDLEIVSWEK